MHCSQRWLPRCASHQFKISKALHERRKNPSCTQHHLASPQSWYLPLQATRRVGRGSLQVTNVLAVRPYTVRKGDTLSSVCEKRGFELKDVLALNYGLDADLIVEGQTILLPASNLSARDKEILGGIGPKTYRTYVESNPLSYYSMPGAVSLSTHLQHI